MPGTRLLVALVYGVLPLTLWAQTDPVPVIETPAALTICDLDSVQAKRPGLGEQPTEVTVGVTVVDLIDIDDVNQSVGLDLYVIMNWTDPGLAGYAGCRATFSEIWNPELELINSGQIDIRSDPYLEINEGGSIHAAMRIQGDISSPHNVRDFPLDSRLVELNIFSPRYGNEDVELRVDPDWSSRAETFTIGNWNVGDIDARVADFSIPELGKTFSRYTLSFHAERYARYYFYKVMLPLGMIALMAFAVFWIDPRQFAAQLSMAATAVLTLIAFQFSLTELLPAVNYLTRMDQFILATNVAVFGAMMESVLIGYLMTHDRQATAIRIDTACRWIFPIAYITFASLMFLLP